MVKEKAKLFYFANALEPLKLDQTSLKDNLTLPVTSAKVVREKPTTVEVLFTGRSLNGTVSFLLMDNVRKHFRGTKFYSLFAVK